MVENNGARTLTIPPPPPCPPARATRSQRPSLLPFDDRAGIPPRSAMAKSDPDKSYTSSWCSKSSVEPTSASPTDSSFTPSPFSGTDSTNAGEWLTYFSRYVAYRQISEPAAIALFALLMRGPADTWFINLSDDDRHSLKAIYEQFRKKYAPAPITLWRRASELWTTEQQPHQSVEEYVANMRRQAKEIDASDDTLRYAIMRGLRASLRPYVMQQDPATCEDLLHAAKVAEATIDDSMQRTNNAILTAINRIERHVAAPITTPRRLLARAAAQELQERRQRQVRFDDQPRRQPRERTGSYQQRPLRPSTPPTTQYGSAQRPFDQPEPGRTFSCSQCGRMHVYGQCVARGKLCRLCNRPNHFAICCRSRTRQE